MDKKIQGKSIEQVAERVEWSVKSKAKRADFCAGWVGHPDHMTPKEYLTQSMNPNVKEPVALPLLALFAYIAVNGHESYRKQAREFYELLSRVGST